MIVNIISTLSFIAWCGIFIVVPIYLFIDWLTTKFSKGKHYYKPRGLQGMPPPTGGSHIGRYR